MGFSKEYVYDKVPYTWLLYSSSVLCALSLVAYTFLTIHYLESFFVVFLLCKATADIVFTIKTKKSYKRYYMYIAGIIDLAACAVVLFSICNIYLVNADFIILLWVILQAVWGTFITITEELERKRRLLNGLAAFLLSFSLTTFIWAKNSFTLIFFSLVVHCIIRLIIALSFREKTDKAIKNYRHVNMISPTTLRY